MVKILFSIAFLASLSTTLHHVRGDEIVALPGLSVQPTFKHYSGYLKASQTHYLHYWFVESQRDPKRDPLITWMNGGPGCSSMEGFLTELGPFMVNADGQRLRVNDQSWNKEANVLFIEAPAGVGYSYSTDGNVTTDDDQTSAENYAALQDFFTKFPEMRANDLYLTGESYAGIYVPTFAVRILQNMASYPLKLKGIATGNGMVSFDLNTDTLLEFAYHHGLIDEKTWTVLRSTCCQGCSDTCAFHQQRSTYCNSTVESLLGNMFSKGLNMYNMYAQCAFAPTPSIKNYSKFKFDMMGLFHKYSHVVANTLRKFAAFENIFENGGSNDDSSEDQNSLGEDPPCTNDTAITSYLNRSDVRKALFIPNFVQQWRICSNEVGMSYRTIYSDMAQQFRTIMSHNVRILVYHGDVDMACNFLMGQKFVAQLNLRMKEQKREWFVGKQIAGYCTRYKGLDFLTVKGAGHMVPTDKPAQSFKMIQSFINNQPY